MATEIGTEGLLRKKLSLPNFFSMHITSEYGRAASAAFFGNAPRTGLAELEARIATCTDTTELERLCHETIVFLHPQGDPQQKIAVPVNVARNNQLIGASREINEFRHGYEPEIHLAIDLLTAKDAVLYDVGANWGPISFQAALRADFSGQIFSFEPQQRAYANLSALIEALGLQERMQPQQLAVSDSAGTAYLSDPQWRGNVSIDTASHAGEACRMVRLDDLSLPPPQLIKIDVEGYEQQVLAGASRLLQEARPYVIFEDWMEHAKAHYQQLQSYGYHFYFLGWYNPFLDSVSDKPPFHSSAQILALQKFEPQLREQFPERINVLAAPHVLTAL